MQTISFQSTADDLIAAYRLHFTASLKNFRCLQTLAPMGAILTVISMLGTRDKSLVSLASVAAQGFCLWGVLSGLILLGNWLLVPRRANRIYSQQKVLHDTVEITWTTDDITIMSKRGTVTLPWLDFISAHKNAKVLILLQSELMFNFIPNVCFFLFWHSTTYKAL